jgi:hypothetical protein
MIERRWGATRFATQPQLHAPHTRHQPTSVPYVPTVQCRTSPLLPFRVEKAHSRRASTVSGSDLASHAFRKPLPSRLSYATENAH